MLEEEAKKKEGVYEDVNLTELAGKIEHGLFLNLKIKTFFSLFIYC
jgi:hypothetical protein